MKVLAFPLAAAAALLALLAVAGSADAQADIGTAAGPVYHTWIGADLRCQSEHGTDGLHEFYPDDATKGDCATWVAVGDMSGTPPMLYGPDFSSPVPATTIGPSAPGGPIGTYTLYTLVSQSPVTGLGTSASPRQVTTVVRAGDIEVTQVDSYVSGNDYYDTTTSVTNRGSSTKLVVVYRAGNCVTPIGDTPAFGWLDLAMGEAGCADNANDMPTGGVTGFVAKSSPGTSSAKIAEGFYGNIWSVLRTRVDFNDLCVCASSGNHGAGIDWRLGLGPSSTRDLYSQVLFLRADPGPPNQDPTVAPQSDASKVTCAEPGVYFDSGARDSDGGIVATWWDFGDGQTGTGGAPLHTYAAAGTYTVRVTVTDDRGATATATLTVTTPGDLNCCPTVGQVASRHTIEGRGVRFPVRGRDGDGDTLVYHLERLEGPTGQPWSFDTQTGWFEWWTLPGDAGAYLLRATVADATCSADVTFSLTIDPLGASDASDEDHDGVSTQQDNCPSVPNLGQEDVDRDGQGDACDDGEGEAPAPDGAGAPPAPPGFDYDADGVPDLADGCPDHPDPSQDDLDGDRTGDACDPDVDGDGVAQSAAEYADNCPRVANAGQDDADADGVGDACQPWKPARTPDSAVPEAASAPRPGPTLWLVALVAAGSTLGAVGVGAGLGILATRLARKP